MGYQDPDNTNESVQPELSAEQPEPPATSPEVPEGQNAESAEGSQPAETGETAESSVASENSDGAEEDITLNMPADDLTYEGGSDDQDLAREEAFDSAGITSGFASEQSAVATGSGTTTPGAANLTIGDINVVILPDTFNGSGQAGSTARTTFSLSASALQAVISKGRISSFTGPAPYKCVIRTRYANAKAPALISAYGRGTTAEDREANNISLQFHESCHGQDYLAYMQNNALPAFGGAVGMAVREFQAEVQGWQTAFRQYTTDMEADSKQNTDCVGVKGGKC